MSHRLQFGVLDTLLWLGTCCVLLAVILDRAPTPLVLVVAVFLFSMALRRSRALEQAEQRLPTRSEVLRLLLTIVGLLAVAVAIGAVAIGLIVAFGP